MAATDVRVGVPEAVPTRHAAGARLRTARLREATPEAAHEHNSNVVLFGPDIMYVRILSDVRIISTSF